MLLDRLAQQHQVSMDRVQHKAACGRGVLWGCRCLLVKLQTYMNNRAAPGYDGQSAAQGCLRARRAGAAGACSSWFRQLCLSFCVCGAAGAC